MQGRFTILVFVLFPLQQTWLTEAQTCSASAAVTLNQPEAARIQQAASFLSKGLTRRDLPVRRPIQPWPYRMLSTAMLTGPSASSAGVTYAAVEHQVLNGVTPAMMVWWFTQNLETVTTYKGDGKNHTLYLQWHPR